MFKVLFIYCISLGLAVAQQIPVQLGQQHCVIEYHPGKSPVLVHLHENERTALAAIKVLASRDKQAWLSLHHNGQRNLRFSLKGKDYSFDPNRIFTAKGIDKNLEDNGAWSPQAAAEVAKLANTIVQLIAERPVIAVHNNKGYSLRDYLPGHSYAMDAKALSFPQKNHYRNFFLVTKASEYQRLKDRGQNVVEQAIAAQDDGSLSILLAKQSYINVEAAYGQLQRQIKMLATAKRIIT